MRVVRPLFLSFCTLTGFDMRRYKTFLLVCAVLAVVPLRAVSQEGLEQLPPDPEVRTGRLDNGLSYYIRYNNLPQGQADMWLVQNTGSLQEDDSQRGLAHFVEHMAFKGTEHFPGNSLVPWLESHGVKLGFGLNAHTSCDMTTYEIAGIPVHRRQLLDSCLLALRDWSDGMLLEDEAIEQERGVIHEEWRIGKGAMERLLERHHGALYAGSKYGVRLPIGVMEVVDHCPPALLRDYYETWYRPDRQAVVIVGEVDVDRMEERIRALFSSIARPVRSQPQETVSVPDNDEPVLISQKEREMPANVAWIMVKQAQMARELCGTTAYFRHDYLERVLGRMLTLRFDRLALEADAPFSSCAAWSGFYLYSPIRRALNVQAIANGKGQAAALRAALVELKRVADHGFAAGEYEAARAELLSEVEKEYNGRDQLQNSYFVQKYVNHFIFNTPASSVDYACSLLRQLASEITLEEVNAYADSLLDGRNVVIISTAPEDSTVILPTVEEMETLLAEVKTLPTEPWRDEVADRPLVDHLPSPGSIVAETENAEMGYTEWTLSNGVRVVLKPTDFKKDEILMEAVSHGGASLYPPEDYVHIAPIGAMWTANGLGAFSATELVQKLSGKQVKCSPYVADYSEGLKGRSTRKDIRTLMQLLYLNFTSPRYDRETFETVRSQVLGLLEHAGQDPQRAFADSLQDALYCHHPKAQPFDKDMATRMDYDRMFRIYKERFANAADFVFIFCGDMDMDSMRVMAEHYLATLPASTEREQAVNDGKVFAAGHVRHTFRRQTENRLAMLGLTWSGRMENRVENRLRLSIAAQLVSNALLARVREEEGAAYSPYAMGYIQSGYDDRFVISAQFGFNPEKREVVERQAVACLEDLATEVPADGLAQVCEFMLKYYNQILQENEVWMDVLCTWEMQGVNKFDGYKEVVERLTPENLREFIAGLLAQGNRLEVVMLPE